MSKRLPTIETYAMPRASDLPRARGPWQLERARTALLVHDMQQYFLRPYAPNASPRQPLIDNIKRLLQAARASDVPVFYTCQSGDQDPRQRGLQKDLWGPGMAATAAHESVIESIAPEAGECVLDKHRYSAFKQSDFADQLRACGRDQLIICGVYAHIGCQLTAADAFQYDIEAFMAADAVADFSRAQHDAALAYLADCLGVVLTTESIEAILHE